MNFFTWKDKGLTSDCSSLDAMAARFEETAKQFSGSYSASDGGRLGWLSEKSLSNKILNRVNKLIKKILI